MNASVKQFVATKVLIEHDDKVLVLRESGKYVDGVHEGQYDVPGGRLAPGEPHDKALLREVKEETGLTISVGEPFAVTEWHPVVRGEQWQVVAIFFVAHSATDTVRLSEDHDDYKWINPKDYVSEGVIANMHDVFEKYLARKKQ